MSLPLLALSLALLSPATMKAEPPDLILVGGRIVTLDPRTPEAVALAVRGGRITALHASEAEALATRGPSTRVVRHPGAFIMPGFIDSHAHLASIGAGARTVDLTGTRSFQDVVARVAAARASVPRGTWILGRGWDQNDWKDAAFPTHRELSAALPEHPVVLTRIDGHACLANDAALRAAAIDASTAAPPGGEILRGADGAPTGVLIDNAMDLVTGVIPPPPPDVRRRDILLGIDACLRHGITTLHDAGVPETGLRLYESLADEGALRMRVYVMIAGGDSATLAARLRTGPRIGLGAGHLTIRAIKLYADGALGSRGAALLEDYSDRPGHRGLDLVDSGTLRKVSDEALRGGWQVCVHAIGDRACREVLDGFEAVFRHRPEGRRARFRVEHAQILDAADIPRFADLGVVAAMQGIHCTSDMPWVPARLGDARTAEGAYAWRSLLDAGAVIANGTDAPVEQISPLSCFYASVTRQDPEGSPSGGFIPAQRMTRIEALRSYTTAGAWAAFEEDEKGRLTPGFRADIAVLDRDILDCPAPEILTTQVLHTIVGGRTVYEAAR